MGGHSLCRPPPVGTVCGRRSRRGINHATTEKPESPISYSEASSHPLLESETKMIASVLNNISSIAQPKTDKWLSSPSHFSSFFTV